MLVVLAETEARIKNHPFTGDSRGFARTQPRHQVSTHFGHDIVIVGGPLHASRLALHMHHAYRQARGGGRLEGTRTLQGAHIVDQTRTSVGRRSDYRRRTGIHGNHHIQVGTDRLHHGNDSVQLFLLRDLGRAGTCGLATHIDNNCPFAHHLFSAGERQAQIQPAAGIVTAAIGEGVRRGIENAHYLRALQIQRLSATVQFHTSPRHPLNPATGVCRTAVNNFVR